MIFQEQISDYITATLKVSNDYFLLLRNPDSKMSLTSLP